MREVTYEEYREFFRSRTEVIIDGTPVKLIDWGHLKLFEPKRVYSGENYRLVF